MADNTTVDNGSLTDYTVADDDDGTAKHQYVKVEFGGDGTQTKVTSSVGLPVSPVPATSGGLNTFRSLDIDETEEAVKASAGQVYGWLITNTATTTRWIKFYDDTVANVSVGTTTPVITWGIPGNTSDDIGANLLGAQGIAFANAITVAATTGFADNDTGAPTANDVIINVFYK